jgi:hypothetical protein
MTGNMATALESREFAASFLDLDARSPYPAGKFRDLWRFAALRDP